MFNKLLALLIVYTHNVHVYHWKLAGDGFQPDHELLGVLYDTMGDHIDSVAEIGLQYGENPLMLQEAISLLDEDSKTRILVSASDNYSCKDAFSKIIVMYKEIIDEMSTICSNQSLLGCHKAAIETMQEWYALRANYLFPRRFVSI